jgi:hypothetical protein
MIDAYSKFSNKWASRSYFRRHKIPTYKMIGGTINTSIRIPFLLTKNSICQSPDTTMIRIHTIDAIVDNTNQAYNPILNVRDRGKLSTYPPHTKPNRIVYINEAVAQRLQRSVGEFITRFLYRS